MLSRTTYTGPVKTDSIGPESVRQTVLFQLNLDLNLDLNRNLNRNLNLNRNPTNGKKRQRAAALQDLADVRALTKLAKRPGVRLPSAAFTLHSLVAALPLKVLASPYIFAAKETSRRYSLSMVSSATTSAATCRSSGASWGVSKMISNGTGSICAGAPRTPS